MTIHDSRAITDAINARNARTSDRAEAGAWFVVLLVLAVLGGLALLHFASPCETGHLCLAPVLATTRSGFLHRQVMRIRAAYLRAVIRLAEDDTDHLLDEQTLLPLRIAAHKSWISARRVELIACELDSRNN